ncbi:PIG-L family deacetylase [Sphingomonas sp. CROZ-RG-20F-R02-07]|uniref:PIG-L deacetylase family protein n=1 Tax=Sphingomonas sp. CROZ-RG-20F-R02-07 TaxID=2914832 RepID=UPI001F571C18
MRLGIGHPRAALVVAPHPDDEAIGAFGLIGALRRGGVRVDVLVVSDGAASHPNSLRWPRAHLVAERRRETRRAMRRLGLTTTRVHFLGLPDGALSTSPAACRSAIRRAVARRPRLDLLVGPVADDAHPDHRMVAQALAAAPFAGRRLAYRVWPPTRTGAPGDRLLPHPHARLARASIIRGYRTQMGAIADDPAGFAIAVHEFAAFARPVERFAVVRA